MKLWPREAKRVRDIARQAACPGNGKLGLVMEGAHVFDKSVRNKIIFTATTKIICMKRVGWVSGDTLLYNVNYMLHSALYS